MERIIVFLFIFCLFFAYKSDKLNILENVIFFSLAFCFSTITVSLLMDPDDSRQSGHYYDTDDDADDSPYRGDNG